MAMKKLCCHGASGSFLLVFVVLSLPWRAAPVTRDEIQILLTFKASIVADPLGTLLNWNNNSSSTNSACNWTGIACDPDSHHITSITLTQTRLQGTIPPQLGALPHLTLLNISYNNFTGPLPSQLGNLTSLLILDLSNNYLNTTIPPSLGDLSSVQYLWLHENLLTGSIPPSIGNCTSLQSFSLAYNYLSGVIPPSLAECSRLRLLALQQNSIIGSIPQGFGKLAHLEVFLLYENNLTGIIPPSLANCSEMNDFELSKNSLQGPIPPELGQLRKLIWLILFDNKLTGTIPASLGNCTSLTDLEIGSNSLHGTVPPAFFQFNQLVYLDLSMNNFSGSIPPIGNLSVLLTLSLSNNLLQGSIPAEIGRLRGLQGLSLANNRLTGGIPDQLANCTQLSELILSHNSLAGSITPSLEKLQFLNYLNLGKNALHGQIPSGIANCTRLESLFMDHNELSGELPGSIAALPSLQFTLDVSHNLLSGSLPPQLGSLFLVQSMDLSGNGFNGVIPASIGNCAGLLELNLAENNLSGSLPSSTAGIQGLTYLNLSHNSLSGNLPIQVGSLEHLAQLDLSYNRFTGLLTTQSLQNLSSLVYLNVSYNDFSGPIPEGGIFKNLTENSFLGNVGLCGPVLHEVCPQQASSASTSKCHLTLGAKFGIGFGACAFCAMLSFVGVIWFRKLKRSAKPPQSIVIPFTLGYQYLTVEDIQAATDGFSEENVIGRGGASTVYRAKLSDGSLLAVKKLFSQEAATRSFFAELQSLGTIRHRNLVRIHGYISGSETKILLLDLMPNGSLDAYLHSAGKQCDFTWEARLQIIMGITYGLFYLHHDCTPPIIHRDLKPSNILLDADMEPHISDFGLAKLSHAQTGDSNTNVSASNFEGSIGYMAPENALTSKVSPKSDVYSYGIIILELITGRRPNDPMFDQTCSLPSWVQSHFLNDMCEVLDTILTNSTANHEEIFQVLKVALLCTKENPDQRPTIDVVLHLLEVIKPNRLGEMTFDRLQLIKHDHS